MTITVDLRHTVALGKHLATTRSNRGVTVEEVARAAGLRVSFYEDMERGFVADRAGVKSPVAATVKQYEAVAQALDLDPAVLFRKLGVEYAPTRDEEPMNPPDNFSTLGALLRHQRENVLHNTLREVAPKIGVTYSVLGQWERGNLRPRPNKVAKLAKAYRIPPEHVVSLLEQETRQTRLTLPPRAANLTPSARKALIAHMDWLLDQQEHDAGD